MSSSLLPQLLNLTQLLSNCSSEISLGKHDVCCSSIGGGGVSGSSCGIGLTRANRDLSDTVGNTAGAPGGGGGGDGFDSPSATFAIDTETISISDIFFCACDSFICVTAAPNLFISNAGGCA